MSTFTLDSPFDGVEVTLPMNLTKQQLLDFIPFRQWLDKLNSTFAVQEHDSSHPFHAEKARYSLRSIVIQSVDWFGNRIGFIKLDATIQNGEEQKSLPGVVFMRGGSVAILMILRSEENERERYVVMTQQPRIPAGSLSFFEIPAGMIDDSGTFVGAAARELREETGLTVPAQDLIDMTEKALAGTQSIEKHLERAMYPTPGGSDEFIVLFLWEQPMSRMELNDLRDRLAGVDREKITVKLVKYEELWREGARDAKTLAALALYEGLSREGSL